MGRGPRGGGGQRRIQGFAEGGGIPNLKKFSPLSRLIYYIYFIGGAGGDKRPHPSPEYANWLGEC